MFFENRQPGFGVGRFASPDSLQVFTLQVW
jgi:hypothetical protein